MHRFPLLGLILAFDSAHCLHFKPRDIEPGCHTTHGTTKCGIGRGAVSSTIEVASNGQSTWSETYYASSLTEFASYTATTPMTITTTDRTGETVVAAVFAAGVAWLAVPKPGVPPVAPPEGPPISEPPITTKPEPTSTSSSSSFSSSSSRRGTQTPIVDYYPNNMKRLVKQIAVFYDDNQIQCVTPSKDIPTVEQNKAKGMIDDFCSDKAHHVALPGRPVERIFSLGAGINLNVSASAWPLCENTFDSWTIDEGDCKHFLGEALNGCDKKTLDKSGATVNDACLEWRFVPDFNPGDLECTGSIARGTGVNHDEAYDNIHDFCGRFAQSLSTPEISNSRMYKPITGNSETIISVDYSKDEICPQDGEDAGYKIDEVACERFLRRTIDDCNTNFKGNAGKFGGNITDGCGVFSLATQVTEKTLCGGMGTLPSIKRTDAIAAINQYCDRDLSLDPSFHRGNHFYQKPPKGASWDTYIADGYAIKLQATFGDLGFQSGCAPAKKFSTKGEECKRKLGVVLDQCPADVGGQLSTNTAEGCVLWSMYADRTS